MNKKRVAFHVLFWLAQYGLSLYTELYLSHSFSRNPSLSLLLQYALAVSVPLIITMAATYYILYLLIPRWIQNYSRKILYLEAIGTLLLATLCVRLAIQHIVWNLIYDEPIPDLSFLQWIARYSYTFLNLLQVVGIAAAIKLFKLRIGAVKNEKALVQEKLQSEMMRLKAQLNPHFLFNAINSIYSLARSQSQHTADALIRLSKMLRYVIYETEQKTILLGEELRVIDDYIQLQQLRFGRRLRISTEKHLDDTSALIAPMLLLPLVENAYKHGSEEGGEITVVIHLKQNQFSFTIVNPVAANDSKKINQNGIGLGNIKRQLELMYRDFLLETELKENTFKATLKINLVSYAGFELFDHRR